MTVADYLSGQDVKPGETAQDEYLDLMQQLADGAFGLLLETGLAASGDTRTLGLWRKLGSMSPGDLAKRLGAEWLDRLMLPDRVDGFDNPADFCRRHFEILDGQTQSSFGALEDFDAVREASGLLMGLALHLGRALGVEPTDLVGHWIGTAKGLGALE
jgi:hypothetical protein